MATGIATDHSAPRRVPRPRAARTGITYEQYLHMSETMKRYEIIDGEMIMPPAPSDRHQMRLAALFRGFDDYVRAKGLGIVLFAPLDIFVHKRPRLRTRQPDLAYWSAGRVGGTSGTRFLNAREADLPPDLVVEVLSPDETRRRLASKLADYASIGIGEVWLVGEQLEAIEVLMLHEGSYQRGGLYGRGEASESHVLAGFSLEVDTLFADEE